MRRLLTINTIIYLVAFGIFANLGYIGYMAFWPFKTIVVKPTSSTATYKIKNQQPIKPGEVLVYEADYCRYVEVPATVVRTIVGPTVLTLANDQSTTEKGCRKIDVKNTVLPDYIPPGKYHMKITACYQVNPIRNICHYFTTETFEVR